MAQNEPRKDELQEVDAANLIQPTAKKLTEITDRIRAEATEKRKQSIDLNKLAENIEETNKVFWSSPDFNNTSFPKGSEQIIASAGSTISHFHDYLTNRPLGEIGKKEIYQFIIPSGDLISAVNTTSSGTLAINMGISLPQPSKTNDEVAIAFVESNLPTEHLRRMFKEAWDSFYAATEDPNRVASFMMREVVSQVFHHEAPAHDVIKAGIEGTKPTRMERSQYIVSKKSGSGAEFMREALNNLRSVYESLNIAHAHESIESKRARIKSFLLEATHAMHLYLKNR